jgi:hypothetical protein
VERGRALSTAPAAVPITITTLLIEAIGFPFIQAQKRLTIALPVRGR